ncbi:MAG: nitrous oxide reductase accessory protein NosL [Chitinophagales bacterium]
MTVADARFGTEIIMRTGKYYIFDDTHCMLAFVQEQAISREDIKEILVSDYQSPHNLIPVASAYFMQGGNVRGPMGGDLAAFADSTERDRFLNDSGGNTIRWDEIF